MKRIMGFGLLAVLPLVLGGCFELKQDATLNPDGSGKMVVEMVMPDMSAMMMGDKPAIKPDPEVAIKTFAKGILDNSRGVETWTDVSFAMADDGRMKFKGTAFFKDISKLSIAAGKGDSSGVVTWTKSDKGGMVLTMVMDGPGDPKPPAAQPPAMTDEEINKAVQAMKMQWPQMRQMFEMMVGKLKMDTIVHLPGTVAEVNGFKKEADGSVRLSYDGAKILEVLDKLMADEAYLKAAVKAGKDPMKDKDPVVFEKMFGTKGPLSARATGDMKPAFDFEKECKAAKDAYPKMIEKLGLDKVPAGGGPALRIGPSSGPALPKPAEKAPVAVPAGK
jgi:hypothetical protein